MSLIYFLPFKLSRLAEKKGIKLEEIIFNFKEKIGQHLADIMLERVKKNLEPINFLKELMDLCGFSNIKSFLNTVYN